MARKPPSPVPPDETPPPLARGPLRRLRPYLFGLAVLAGWYGLVVFLAPDVFTVRWNTPEGNTPSEQTRLLTAAIPAIDDAVAKTLLANAPGVRPITHHEQLELRHAVQWRSSRVEIQLPSTAQPEAVLEALKLMRFDESWKVVIKQIESEPLSATLQITVDSYPTHLLTLHPTLSQSMPLDASPDKRIKIAILIDDLGMSEHELDPLWELETPFSVAIIPFTPYALALSQEAWTRHKEILVHLPMEALPRPDGAMLPPQLGGLTLAMTLEQLKTQTKKAVRAVPYAAGVNNHQGSAFTRDRNRMTGVLEVLKAEGLFFVDSKTIADSVGYSLAKSMGIPATERQVFLDNDTRPQEILQALGRLRSIALKRGQALGICHPHRSTIQVLKEWLPRTAQEGFALVPVSGLLTP